MFNSGVVLFKHGISLISDWALAEINYEGNYHGDKDVLSRVIYNTHAKVNILPIEYNWRVLYWGENKEAGIIHWSGNSKEPISKWIRSFANFILFR